MICRPVILFVAATCVVSGFVAPIRTRTSASSPGMRQVPLFSGFERVGNSEDGDFTLVNDHWSAVLRANDASLVVFGRDKPTMRMFPAGAVSNVRGEPIDRLPGRVNYLIGNDPARWRTGVPRYAGIRFAQVYPGIDLVYRQTRDGVEYDFVVEPGANPQAIRLEFDGAAGTHVDVDGDLVLQTAGGEVRHRKPHIYQDGRFGRREIEGAFIQRRNGVAFSIGLFDRDEPLTIDPTIVFGTTVFGARSVVLSRLGGQLVSITVDAEGNSYVAGTAGGDLPTTPGVVQPRLAGFPDCFVAKLDPRGNLQYLTYLGGDNRRFVGRVSFEGASGISVDALGQVVIGGATNSSDFPTVNAFQPMPQSSGTDGFVAKLDASGSRLIYSTYLGGVGGSTNINAVALDVIGNAYVTGRTFSMQFPAQRMLGPPTTELFVAKFNPAGGLGYATRFGSTSGFDTVRGIAVHASGQTVVVGDTFSGDFPIVSATAVPRPTDFPARFVASLNAAGTDFVFSTYFGTVAGFATTVAIDGSGNSYVAGQDSGRLFVGRYDARGNMTFFQQVAPIAEESPSVTLALDAAGGVYVAGETFSPNLPVVYPLLSEHPGGPIYKSINGGAQWVPSSRGGLLLSVLALAFDSAGRLWAGTASGVAESTDDGTTWQLRNNGFVPGFNPRINSLAPDSQNAAVLHIVDGISGIIYKTTDAGNSWSRLTNVGNTGLQNVQTLVVDPASSNTFYAAGLGGIRRSVDDGRTWTAADMGAPRPALTVYSLVVDPTNTSTSYAGSSDGVFKSTDSGRTWTPSGAGLSTPTDVRQLAIDPFSPSVLYAAAGARVFKSTDGANTWSVTAAGPPSFGAGVIAIDPRVRGTVYTARVNAGPEMVFKSPDAGATWAQSGSGILNATVNALVVDPRSGILYAAGNMASVPYAIHLIPGAPELSFSTYLPSGRTPAIAVSVQGEIFLALVDSGVVVQRISEADCKPCRPRKYAIVPRVCGC